MQFSKPSLAIEQQADLLLQRGMLADRDLLISRLQSVSYYRLSGYWYPFRQFDPKTRNQRIDNFQSGSTFEEIWNRYVFDRHLRLLTMDAIERIEVAVRSLIAHYHGQAHGPFAYYDDAAALPSLRADQLLRFLGDMDVEYDRSKEAFVEHFKSKYGDEHGCLPIWMACEVMSFGSILTLHRGCSHHIRQRIAKHFEVHDTVFDSWLLALNVIRNICAHHGRLWNRELGIKPKIPKNQSHFHAPVLIGNDRLFGILSICRFALLRIAPQSSWASRLKELLLRFPNIPIQPMGFPLNWQNSPIWQ